MPNTSRLTGRFFSVLISIVLVVLMPRAVSFAQGPTLCDIVDTVYRADGTPAQGSIVLQWTAFTTAAGQPVAAGTLTVQLGQQGQFTASLAPNSGATPAGTYYRATYKLSDGTTTTEFWSVPATQTTTIGAIRSTLAPATQAAQYLTRTYADSHYLDLTDDQSVSGVKTFASSPSVPTPQNPNDAANKGYVDAATAGGGGNLSSPPPIGNVTPNVGNFTTLTVQTENGIPNPAHFPQGDPCAQINAAIGALPSVGGTVDARGFAPSETCNTTIAANKPVTIQFGAGTWTLNGNPGINVSAPNVVIECPASTILQLTSTTLMSGAAAPLIANFADPVVNGNNYHTADATQVLNCTLDGNGVGTFGIFAPAVYSMKIHGVHARAFTAANILVLAGQNDMYNTVADDSVQRAWQGEYQAVSDSLPMEDVLPGNSVQVFAPSRGAAFSAIVRQVEVQVLSLADDRSVYAIKFANDTAQPLALEFETMTLPAPLTTIYDINTPSSSLYIDPLTAAQVTSVIATEITIDAGAAPPAGGYIEVRRSDGGWGTSDIGNLAGRFTSETFTLPRLSRAQAYYLRQYDGSTPGKYSRYSVLLHVDYPL